ncbi:DUF92 domain-containing protein [Paraflavisolibacter sp. H34]|uniref:DUF92 domain-containing protein n=1 Tax=Huijunlia imazamoxiresistens TaxID=3127457 RepID=UPI0030193F7A
MWNYWILLLVLGGGMYGSVKARKLTPAAALAGGVAGFLVFLGAGFTGIAQMATFFLLGTSASSVGLANKVRLGLAEANKGQRQAGQVLANAGLPALLGLLAVLLPQQAALFRLLVAAAFASACADTLSSELGNVYGRRFYNILTFKRESRGPDGVISLEGTLCGVAGSAVIALIYALGFGWHAGVLWIVLAGTAGNLADSLLGAALERKGVLGNDTVNLLNTLTGALAGWGLWWVFA